MHETLYPITRQHKLKRIEEEFLRRLSTKSVPAYQMTAQDFFTYIAREIEETQSGEFIASGKMRKHYRTRISYEQEKRMIQEVKNGKRGSQKSIAEKYNISFQQLRTIMRKFGITVAG